MESGVVGLMIQVGWLGGSPFGSPIVEAAIVGKRQASGNRLNRPILPIARNLSKKLNKTAW